MTKKYVSTWDAMKMSASPSEMKELNRIELESLKNRQMFHSSTPVEERKNIMKNNRELRKEAKKILKDENLTHRFMTSKTVDEFENKTKIPMTRDTLEPSFESPEASMELKNSATEVRGLDTVVYQGKPDEMRTPESERLRVPEFFKQEEAIRSLLPEEKLRDYDERQGYIEILKEQKEEEEKNSSKGLPHLLGLPKD